MAPLCPNLKTKKPPHNFRGGGGGGEGEETMMKEIARREQY